MNPNAKAAAIREPRVGDVWRKEIEPSVFMTVLVSAIVEDFCLCDLSYRRKSTHNKRYRLTDLKNWAATATLIERGPEVRG